MARDEKMSKQVAARIGEQTMNNDIEGISYSYYLQGDLHSTQVGQYRIRCDSD